MKPIGIKIEAEFIEVEPENSYRCYKPTGRQRIRFLGVPEGVGPWVAREALVAVLPRAWFAEPITP